MPQEARRQENWTDMTTTIAFERKAAALERKEASAIKYIKKHEPNNESYAVAYSAGEANYLYFLCPKIVIEK